MNEIRIAGAGAGTGKTYFLTHELADSIRDGVSPASIVATTFTRKAAAELRERVRQLLLENGRTADAGRIFEGYIGTVHSVCARLLSEYAVDAGLSPAIEVMPEGDDERFFRIAVASIVEGYVERLEGPAERLEIDGSGRGYQKRRDWRGEVQGVVDLARANAIDGDALRECGRQSAQKLIAVLSGGKTVDEARFERLGPAVDEALARLRDIEAPKKATQAAIELLEDFKRSRSGKGAFSWSKYAKLSKQEVNKDAAGILDEVQEIAGEFVFSDRFKGDLETVIRGVVDCAADSLDAYAQYKRSQGLMDYTDQETLVLQLARNNERFRAGISESVKRLFVDEFQDTSPIQLALFLALHEISGSSLWVGDPKQAIYGFRGTDPALMDAAARRLGTDTTLGESWRSSELLVRFSNAVFGPVLGARGYPAVSLSIPEERAEEAAGGRLETWYLRSKNNDQDAVATAAGVARMLQERTDLVPGDIAVLSRKNDECSKIAQALSTFGVDASVGHGKLNEAAECRLAMAALRFISDEDDSLALAEFVHTHPEHFAHGRWLTGLMDAPGEEMQAWRADPALKRLDDARSTVRKRSPEEALEQAIELIQLPRLLASWRQPERRRANLDALRGVCAEYLSTCSARRTAATIPGFIQYYRESNSEQAKGSGADTVQVLTYHGAKGLEWKVVVLASLDSAAKDGSRVAFGVAAESEGEINLDDPLAGRSIRYWPWPFGGLSKVPGINSAIAASSQHRSAVEHAHDESLRLLYVGVTRAREELVLAARYTAKGELKASWVDELTATDGEPVVKWPPAAEADAAGKPATIHAGGESFETHLRVLAPEESAVSDRATGGRGLSDRYLQPLPRERREYPTAHITPTALEAGELPDAHRPTARLFADLGERIPSRSGIDETTLGTAVHATFAAAYSGISGARLIAVIKRVLRAYGITGEEATESVVEANKRLAGFVARTWPEARVHREWPVSLRLKTGQRMQGWIDLLVETAKGRIIIDHKTFPGRNAEERIERYAPQLRAYSDAVEAAGGEPVTAGLIHLPFLGKVYEVDSPSFGREGMSDNTSAVE